MRSEPAKKSGLAQGCAGRFFCDGKCIPELLSPRLPFAKMTDGFRLYGDCVGQYPLGSSVSCRRGGRLLLGEEIFYFFVGYDFGFEDVSSGFVGFHHLDAFGYVLAVCSGFERGDYLLCHDYLISR